MNLNIELVHEEYRVLYALINKKYFKNVTC